MVDTYVLLDVDRDRTNGVFSEDPSEVVEQFGYPEAQRESAADSRRRWGV